MEYRANPVRGVTMYGYLSEATEETFLKQELPPLFLVECNNRRSRVENLIARVVGPKQGSDVEVTYNFSDNDHLGHAVGFQGNKWTFFCLQNEIEVGHRLLFTDMRSQTFNMEIFTVNGVGIDIPSLGNEEEGQDPNYSDCVMSNVEEDIPTVFYKHRCSHFEHRHKSSFPHFFKKLEIFSPHRKNLMIPKDFVRMHQVHAYNGAVLHFGRLVFCCSLEVHLDRLREGDKDHLLLVIDWYNFMEKTGVSEGRVLRFQMNVGKSIPGQLADFDVC